MKTKTVSGNTPVASREGIHAVLSADIGERCHSRHGSLQESMYVFIVNGLRTVIPGRTRPDILEIGFGTGLNALLTYGENESPGMEIHCTAVDAFPLSSGEAAGLNFTDYIGHRIRPVWTAMHEGAWETDLNFGRMILHKVRAGATGLECKSRFDLVYYEAFSPKSQPEQWTAGQLMRIAKACRGGAVCITYCANSRIRRNLQATGFDVEKLEGPAGKREMTRATRQH